ncbi:MAG: ATP-binding cassette domain-containing protein [Clostridium sp.]|nr:ATP-binding cassette domain-containing protein [Clostridium sp.]
MNKVSEKAYVEIKNLNKVIKKNVILSDINLNLYRGKVYGFCGINGSGKSMLFRAISGLIKPTEGEIVIDGKVLGKDISFPESFGMLIENPGFLPNYTGFQNLKYLADIKKIINDDGIKQVLSSVGLSPNDTRKYKKFSLGMKQKLGIAQAVMEDPDLIILDEPTNALDEDGQKMVRNLILELKKKGKLILITNHNRAEMENIADEIYTIKEGKIVEQLILEERKNC